MVAEEVRLDSETSESATWTMACGWELRFVRMAPDATLALLPNPQQPRITIAKVLRGALTSPRAVPSNVSAPPRGTASALLPPDAAQLVAGSSGAVAMLLSAPQRLLPHAISAPLVELAMSPALPWLRVEDLPWGRRAFRDVPFFANEGWRVWADGAYLCAVRLWAARAGTDCGDHDHGEMPESERFCEVHLCLHNATGAGGMVCGATALPLQQGDEHGPFWERVGPAAVRYPTHRWQAGPPANAFYDVWAAFEFPPSLAVETAF